MQEAHCLEPAMFSMKKKNEHDDVTNSVSRITFPECFSGAGAMCGLIESLQSPQRYVLASVLVHLLCTRRGTGRVRNVALTSQAPMSRNNSVISGPGVSVLRILRACSFRRHGAKALRSVFLQMMIGPKRGMRRPLVLSSELVNSLTLTRVLTPHSPQEAGDYLIQSCTSMTI